MKNNKSSCVGNDNILYDVWEIYWEKRKPDVELDDNYIPLKEHLQEIKDSLSEEEIKNIKIRFFKSDLSESGNIYAVDKTNKTWVCDSEGNKARLLTKDEISEEKCDDCQEYNKWAEEQGL